MNVERISVEELGLRSRRGREHAETKHDELLDGGYDRGKTIPRLLNSFPHNSVLEVAFNRTGDCPQALAPLPFPHYPIYAVILYKK